MTIIEIARRYYESTGHAMPDFNNGAAVLPFIMMEIARDAFSKGIRFKELTLMPNKIRNDWAAYNDKFFRDLERHFVGDEYQELLDLMDEVQAYCERHLLVLRVQIMNAVDEVDYKCQQALAAAQLANIMAQESEDLWELLFRTACGQHERNHYMKAVRHYSCRFTGEYFKQIGGTHVNFNESENIIKAVKGLENRILLWFKQKYDEQFPDKIS